MSRYVVVTCEGFLSPRVGDYQGAPPGKSYVVLDRLGNCRLIAQYRTEGYQRSGRPLAEQFALAEDAAQSHAARLNG